MVIPSAEPFKKEGITAVLTRLGEPMFVLLKLSLAQEYKINIDKNDSYTLEELHLALQKILGPGGASLLSMEIRNEIELLARPQTR